MAIDAVERVLLVSGDSHAGPTLEALREYCPKAHLGAFDDFSRSPRVETMRTDTRKGPGKYLNTKGHNDPEARLVDMDRDGIAAEIIFHNSFNGEPMPFDDIGWPEVDNPSLAGVGFRIYNRWLADFCAYAPERLVGATITCSSLLAVSSSTKAFRTPVLVPCAYREP